jgi:hypothetical protein
MSQDLIDMYKLSDVLTPPDFVVNAATPVDVPMELRDLYEYKMALMNTKKPVNINIDNNVILKKIHTMTEVVGIS